MVIGKTKKLLIWTLVATIFGGGILTIFANPQKARAADFTASNFHVVNGVLTHTYTVDGTTKTQKYINGKTVDGSKIYGANNKSYWDGNSSLYIYEMAPPKEHRNTNIGSYSPQTSNYYIAVVKKGSEYKSQGLYFYSACTQITACTQATTQGERFYFRTFASQDNEDIYDKNSGFYQYIQYLDQREYTVYGIGSGVQSKECSISGKISINWDGQILGTETGQGHWPKGKLQGGSFFTAQLWYQGPGATTYENTGETTKINDQGEYSFPAKARQTGKYLVTVMIIRPKNGTFMSSNVGTIETADDKVNIDKSYFTVLEDPQKEGFFGQTEALEIVQNCSNIAGKDIVLKSVGIKQDVATGDETCDYVGRGIGLILAKVLCAILTAMGKGSEWLIDTLRITTVINAYSPSQYITALSPFSIHKVYAQDPNPGITEPPNKSSIKKALDGEPPWILKSWKVVLGLADVFVVIILLFLAITNILHIKYDDYAIKKSLPTLIAGVILANFSVFITKMLVDATNALTATFTGGDAGTMVKDIITAVIPTDGKPQFLTTTSLFGLILAIFFAFFAIVVFLILGFLFYIRYIVILTLTIAAPLAFVLMAFPPTQGIFKQWWGWYAKFIFMKPISIFLLWLASMVLGSSGGNNITAWAIAVFLSVAAIIVPFKMGGAIMGGWGALGKKGAGLAGKGLSKATEVQRARLGNRFANSRIGRWQQGRQMELDTLKSEREGIMAKHEAANRKKKGSRQTLREREVEYAKGELEAEKMGQTLAVEEGKFNHISKRQMRKITGKRDPMDVAQKYIEQANRLKQAEEGLTKRRDLDLQNLSIRDLREDDKFREQIETLSELDSDYNESGELSPTKMTFYRAIEVAEELRFRAKSETDPVERQKLLDAVKHLGTKTKAYEQTNKNDAGGNSINYQKYLSRNLAGRRQKVLNPAVNEEAEVQVLSSTHTGLVTLTDDPSKTFGTSEWQARNIDYDDALKGDYHKLNASAAYACRVQLQATNKVMSTARSGDIKGMETMDLFTKRVEKVKGRKGFKKAMTIQALAKMDDTTKVNIQNAMAQQKFGKNWSALTSAADQDAAMQDFNFTKLDVTSRTGNEGKGAAANRAFLDRFHAQIELDDKIGLSNSPGSVFKRTRPKKP